MAGVMAMMSDTHDQSRVSPNLQLIENRLRAHSYTKRIRVEEFFKDFDRLRTGYITQEQFRRAINRNFTNSVTDDEFYILADKYKSPSRPNCINYKDFIATIDSVFNQNIIEKNPLFPPPSTDDMLSNMRTQHLSSDELEHYKEVMERVQKYVDYHGINIKNCYADFDKHHNGLVTENQFHRNFPVLSHFSKDDIGILAKKYMNQKSHAICYLRFHRDLVDNATETRQLSPQQLMDTMSGTLGLNPGASQTQATSVEDIEERVRVEMFKHRIRVIEFFKDYDRHCDGLITENQFLCGLSLCRFLLSRKDISRLVDKYSNEDGRIRYKDFCDSLNTIFTINHLEKTPQKEVYPPTRERLVKEKNRLTAKEEERHQAILEDLRRRVQTRRVQMLPFFKDFDKGQGNTGRITRNHFCRLLAIVSLEVPSEDMKVLIRKYEDRDTGDINYPAFIREVDLDSNRLNVYPSSNDVKESPAGNVPATGAPNEEVASIDMLLARIKYDVLIKRVRVTEFFRDFDKLRSGCISKAQFRQGLCAMGQHLNDSEMSVLEKQYKSTAKPDMISHARFSQDIDTVFHGESGDKGRGTSGGNDVSILNPMGVTPIDSQQEELVQTCLAHFRERIEQRRIMVKPIFYDFDKHNNGHVTQNQFLQCLTYLGLEASPAQVNAIFARFCDNSKRFNYLAFLVQLNINKSKGKGKSSLSERRQYNHFVQTTKNEVEIDQEELIHRLQHKVMKDRIRVIEFMCDYDKLRTGRIPKASFRRALNMCAFNLTEHEIKRLEKFFEAKEDPSMVYYVKFSDLMEEAFTIKGLEKHPTLDVKAFEPSISTEKALLSPRSEKVHDLIMHKIAEKVRTHRMIILPHFEDYDRVHNGSVSKSQFRSVLSHFNLQLDDMESNILYKKYDIQVGGIDDVDYIRFTNKIAEYSQQAWKQDEADDVKTE